MAGVERKQGSPEPIKGLIQPEYKQIVIIGEGFISSGQDQGSFIARNSFAQSDQEWTTYCREEEENPDVKLEQPAERIRLTMAGLFPPEWNEQEIEYEITVKAKLKSPFINPAEGE